MFGGNFGKDFLASIVVFLVALPLCMGIALASGVPPALGLITGMIGGIVVGFLAGSPLQVSGPAAGLAVLVYQVVNEHGLAVLGPILLIAGAIQLVAGLLKLGQWFRAISPSVIYGMLAGIGVLIFASQFHVMVDDSPRGGGLLNLVSIPEALYKGIVPSGNTNHHLAAGIGLLTILTILGWNRLRPEKLKMLPAALLAVVAASVAAAVLGLPIRRIDVPANFFGELNWVTWAGALEAWQSSAIIVSGIVFAFVASAETLLCATAVDQMHDGERTNYDKELAAQGVGNLLCGVVGALPMTGVIVRSSANVQAGAITRASAILHGFWLLGAIALLPWLLSHIPSAALAAILVYTGYKLVNIAQIRKLAKFGRMELVIYFATVIGIVSIDLLSGVVIGLLLSLGKLIYTFAHLQTRFVRSEDGKRSDLYLKGSATFLGLPRLAAALDELPPGTEAHVHVEHLDYIDHACLDLIANFEKRHTSTGGSLTIEWQELANRYNRGVAEGDRATAEQSTLAALSRS